MRPLDRWGVDERNEINGCANIDVTSEEFRLGCGHTKASQYTARGVRETTHLHTVVEYEDDHPGRRRLAVSTRESQERLSINPNTYGVTNISPFAKCGSITHNSGARSLS